MAHLQEMQAAAASEEARRQQAANEAYAEALKARKMAAGAKKEAAAELDKARKDADAILAADAEIRKAEEAAAMRNVRSPSKSPDENEAPAAPQGPGPMTSRYLAMPTTRLEAEAQRAAGFDAKVAAQSAKQAEEIAKLEREVLSLAKRNLVTPTA